ncbi:flippase [Nodosilinea sp. PGN35]|uniref:flippase n=1 Tax=Nodosilinea sp. PGN35 TaxID=3020489 RepID=UPI0023B34BA0|nr:flippase [Nodosilinea sp. TSF1-S3]MDF0367107.1 flippase [Nodosilinea sp. TSF1-S3]
MLERVSKLYGGFDGELRQVLSNTSWLFVGRSTRLLVSLLVSTWVARYLKPEGFGSLQYALAFVSFFSPLSTVQMGPIVTRDLVRQPDQQGEILGTAVGVQVVGGLGAIALSILGMVVLAPDQPLAQLLVAIVALKYLFNSLQPIENWFEAQIASKYAVLAEQGAFLLVVILKIALVLNHAPVATFAAIIALEALFYALGLLLFYNRQGQRVSTWRTSLKRAGYLLKESYPLVLSSTACVLYISIDQVMLGQMLNSAAVGIYASAATLSEATSFLPIILCSSLFPGIVKAQGQGGGYRRRLQRLYDLNTLTAYGLVAVLIPLSGVLILGLYGPAYRAALPIFAVHIWSTLFAFLGIAQSKWIVAEGLQIYNLYSRLAGLASNILLNLWLIPTWGGLGAAVATLISYAVGGYLFFWCLPQTRPNARLMTKALALPLRLPQLVYRWWLSNSPSR